MKRLILLRHAKAVAKGPQDFERVLADRGRAEMALMAPELADAAPRPDLALVSPSARTRETWELAGLPEVPVRLESAIYEASIETLLDIVRGAPNDVRCLVLVGHNPGIEELALGLADAASQVHPPLRSGLPTAALVVFDIPVEAWREVAAGSGRLDRMATPGSLGGEEG